MSDTDTVTTPTEGTDPVANALQDPDARAQIHAAIASFPATLCQRCVGRFMSRLDRTRDNIAIGAVVAHALGLEPRPADDPDCPWCEGIFRETDHLADLVCAATKDYEFDTMMLGTKVHPDIQQLEAAAEDHLEGDTKEWFEPMKTELNRAVGSIVLPRLEKTVDFERADLVVMFDPYFDRTEVEAANLCLHAHYRKYDRTLPQTQWPCNKCQGKGCHKCDGTGQQYGTSVQGLLQRLAIQAFDAEDAAFHGGGREDIDALMLGTGRPFVLELKRPKLRTPRDVTQAAATIDGPVWTLQQLEDAINKEARPRVELEGLRPSDRAEVVAVKDAALDKAYRAHIVAEAPVKRSDLDVAADTVTCTVLKQRTPARVAHRRADKVRERQVHSVQVVAFGHHERAAFEAATGTHPDEPAPVITEDAATHFTLDIVSESGTYIKELVHGDDGRTEPSFAGLLGVPMRVTALDVVGMREKE